jgi:hypothetical protein
MKKIFGFTVIMFLACSAVAASLFDGEDYVQTRCDIDNERAVIWMATPSDVRNGHNFLYNIDFQFPGPVIRFPPQFYAPDWKDIDNITMEYPNRNSNTGTLSLHVREANGSVYIQRIGLVKRDCWNKARRFVEQVLSVRGPVVRVIERNNPGT